MPIIMLCRPIKTHACGQTFFDRLGRLIGDYPVAVMILGYAMIVGGMTFLRLRMIDVWRMITVFVRSL